MMVNFTISSMQHVGFPNKLFSFTLFQFLLIFRKAAAGELAEDSGLFALYQQLEEIDVDKEGVKGAKNFFEAKVSYEAGK